MEINLESDLDDSTYFVEEVYFNKDNALELTIFDVKKYYHQFDEDGFNQEILSDNEIIHRFWKTIILPENQFNFNPQSRFFDYRNGSFFNANNEFLARHYRYIDWSSRSRFYNSKPLKHISPLKKECSSYHVNVGHGNCTFITDGTTSIGVDCSTIDFRNHRSYHKNIVDCIDQIKNDFSLTKFRLNFFILTHPHYDHYSGIDFLCKKNVIDQDTTVYLNQYYSHPNPLKIGAIQRLGSKVNNIIEPIKCNSTSLINIIYPKLRCYKNGSTVHVPHISQQNPNDSSTVVKICSETRSMLITGDIEKKGWKHIDVCNDINNINYYIHSHHGSQNGFTINSCSIHSQATDISACMSNCLQTIILGRTGAFSNMPCSAVTTAFPCALYSEADAKQAPSKFLKLEWDSNKPIWF